MIARANARSLAIALILPATFMKIGSGSVSAGIFVSSGSMTVPS
jgi:hypothetical protein